MKWEDIHKLGSPTDDGKPSLHTLSFGKSIPLEFLWNGINHQCDLYHLTNASICRYNHIVDVLYERTYFTVIVLLRPGILYLSVNDALTGWPF